VKRVHFRKWEKGAIAAEASPAGTRQPMSLLLLKDEGGNRRVPIVEDRGEKPRCRKY